MEKIKVKSKLYEIRSIQTIEPHVLQIVFTGTPPTKWNGDIVLYTAGDIECATLAGWTTVYRDEGQTVYLSDDGSVYQIPDPDTGDEILPPEPYVPTLEELQAAKKREISQACETAIYSGVDVTLTDGSAEHFSLTEHDSSISSVSRYSLQRAPLSLSTTRTVSRAGTTIPLTCS